MGEGSHFLNVILSVATDENEFVECPKTGTEMRVTMNDDNLVSGRDAAPGVLQVAVSASMAGSESEFLPEAYRPLFSDESLRNPLYAKFKAKKIVECRQDFVHFLVEASLCHGNVVHLFHQLLITSN